LNTRFIIVMFDRSTFIGTGPPIFNQRPLIKQQQPDSYRIAASIPIESPPRETFDCQLSSRMR
jgi:hypothetical protein